MRTPDEDRAAGDPRVPRASQAQPLYPVLVHLVVGPDQPLLDELRRASAHHDGGRATIAVAWAREGGVIELLDCLAGKVPELRVIVGVNERGTTVEALLRLLTAASELWVFYKHPTQTFHPKLYAFDGDKSGTKCLTVLVGSPNLTVGGLLSNFEVALRFEGTTADEEADELHKSIQATWGNLIAQPFAHRIDSAAQIEQLYRAGIIVSERTVRRQRRRTRRTEAAHAAWPTAPPPFAKLPQVPPIAIPFALDNEPPAEEAPPESTDPPGATPLPYRFFARTLTANDVAKLHGQQVGTFEPDLGQTARDQYPAFWGWPQRYTRVVRRLPRDEWPAQGRLISRTTDPAGVAIQVMLWYREARPGHPAEHRFRLGPISTVREAVPGDFDETSIVVFERGRDGASDDFTITLLTNLDPGYSDYASYLTEARPEHRFGYGPVARA